MTIFNEAERRYLAGQGLGRLATIGPHGAPHLRPLGFRVNPDETIDLGGPQVAATQRWRDIQHDSRVSFVVDDMTPDGPKAGAPGTGRGIEIRGRAETLAVDNPPGPPEWAGPDIIRIHPERIISWHIDPTMPAGRTHSVK